MVLGREFSRKDKRSFRCKSCRRRHTQHQIGNAVSAAQRKAVSDQSTVALAGFRSLARGEIFGLLDGELDRMMRRDLGFADGHSDGRKDLHPQFGWRAGPLAIRMAIRMVNWPPGPWPDPDPDGDRELHRYISISRHPRIGWRPAPAALIAACTDHPYGGLFCDASPI